MNLFQQKLLYYSLDPHITLGTLKKTCILSPQQLQLLESSPGKTLTQRKENHHIIGITQEMENYPSKFSSSKTSPYLLYAIGNTDLLNQKVLGIVGPREMSPYASKVMEALFQHLQQLNLITVSGLARGVDQKCHQLSLKYNIPTIAILGGGIKRYLKSSAKHLIKEILQKG
jgi:DNA processing protein